MQAQTTETADSRESAATSQPQDGPQQSGIGDGVLTEAKALVDEYRALARDHIRLAALETRQAGETIVRMVATGVVAGGFALIAWLGMVGAVVAWVIEQNWLNTSTTLLLTSLIHGVGALVLAFVIRRQGRGLLFSAIVQDLDPKLTGEEED